MFTDGGKEGVGAIGGDEGSSWAPERGIEQGCGCLWRGGGVRIQVPGAGRKVDGIM